MTCSMALCTIDMLDKTTSRNKHGSGIHTCRDDTCISLTECNNLSEQTPVELRLSGKNLQASSSQAYDK